MTLNLFFRVVLGAEAYLNGYEIVFCFVIEKGNLGIFKYSMIHIKIMKTLTTRNSAILKVGALAIPAAMAFGCRNVDFDCFPFDPMGPTKSEKATMQVRNAEAKKILDRAVHEQICKGESGKLFYSPNPSQRLEIMNDRETTAQILYAKIPTGNVLVSGDVWVTITGNSDASAEPTGVSFKVTYGKQGYFLGSPTLPVVMEKNYTGQIDACKKE